MAATPDTKPQAPHAKRCRDTHEITPQPLPRATRRHRAPREFESFTPLPRLSGNCEVEPGRIEPMGAKRAVAERNRYWPSTAIMHTLDDKESMEYKSFHIADQKPRVILCYKGECRGRRELFFYVPQEHVCRRLEEPSFSDALLTILWPVSGDGDC